MQNFMRIPAAILELLIRLDEEKDGRGGADKSFFETFHCERTQKFKMTECRQS
jgi:hypothetical protein